MTTEFVLIVALYAFVLLGAFSGQNGPANTFKMSTPRFAAKLERDISVGKLFMNKQTGKSLVHWSDPSSREGQ